MKAFWVFVAIGILGLLCVIGAFVIPTAWSMALLMPGFAFLLLGLFGAKGVYQSKAEWEHHEAVQALLNWLRTPKE